MNINDLVSAIKADPTLDDTDKKHVIAMVSEHDFITKLMYGAFGASLSYIVAKYLGLSKTAQVLLAIAGYGVGRLLLDASKHKDNRFVQYNDKIKLYEINEERNKRKDSNGAREEGAHPFGLRS
jgi:hypothetical protein